MSINGTIKSNGVVKGKIRVIPSIDKTLKKANKCADAKATGDALKNKVNTSDIVDNLATSDSTKPLSAKQGAALKKAVDENRSSIEANKEMCKKVQRKHYILIGDSYSIGAKAQTDVTGWAPLAKTMLEASSTINPPTVTISGLGGTGFIAEKNGKKFIDLLVDAKSLITVDALQITDIVVCGGYNDRNYEQNDIANAIDEFVKQAKKDYPNAIVSIGMIGASANTTDGSITANIAKRALLSYCGTLTKSDSYYRYLNNVENILKMNPLYMDTAVDTFHPSQAGYKALANGIVKAIAGGFNNGFNIYYPKIKGVSGVTFSDEDTTPSVAVIISGDVATIHISKIVANIDTTIIPNFNGNEWLDICTFENSLIVGAEGIHNTISINGFYQRTDGTRERFGGVARINDGVLRIAHFNYDASGNYLSEEVKKICITAAHFVSPTNLY